MYTELHQIRRKIKVNCQNYSYQQLMKYLKKVSNFTFTTMLKRKLSQNASQIPFKTARDSCHIEKSKYFNNNDHNLTFSDTFLNIQLSLNARLKTLSFKPPVAYIYNPVEYAFKPNQTYVTKYCNGPKKILFVGMNPGPFGMCQTGVPFGEVKAVRDWLGINEEVEQPDLVCPARPIQGFNCPKSEVSGQRLWEVIKNLSGSPEKFFRNCFVYNYCPLALMREGGGNLTPSDIEDTKELEAICDEFFFQVIEHLKPEIIIGIGRYVEKRALTILKKNKDLNVKVIFLKHPSPRVINNNNWIKTATDFFTTNDLVKYLKDE